MTTTHPSPGAMRAARKITGLYPTDTGSVELYRVAGIINAEMHTAELLDALDSCRRQLTLTADMILDCFGSDSWKDVASGCRKQASVASQAIAKSEATQP